MRRTAHRVACYSLSHFSVSDSACARRCRSPWPPIATFSILAMDTATGEIGGAVQSRVFSVGNGVLWAEAGVGAVATQAIVDVSYGPQAIELLKKGLSAEQVVKQVWENDPDPRPSDWTKQGRQFAVVDAKGNVFAYTGPRATEWAGHKSCTANGARCTAQGNILAGAAVVDSMVAGYERTAGQHISLRLHGSARGGSARGWRQARHAVRRDAHREEERRRVAQQRRGASASGGRQSGTTSTELRRLVERASARFRR